MSKMERWRNALAGRPVDRPPVWMMRQAGRYLPEYQAVRARYDFLTLCRTPEAAAEVSLQPLRILDVDAVIVFNDIVTPMEAMGTPVVFTDKGPKLTEAIHDRAALDRFRPASFDHDEPVFHTLALLRRELGPDVPLLGFAGAPFTLAAYAIEGALSRNLEVVKAMRWREPGLLHEILARLADTVADYLRIQIEAGADLVQLFDTWAGALSLPDYHEFALRYQKYVVQKIRPLGAPIALYVNGSAPLLREMVDAGVDVLSVDWRLPLPDVRRVVGDEVVLQGNLDPATLFAAPQMVREETRAMLAGAANNARYIANLGHGILPGTPVESVRAFVAAVRGSET
ncbi:uroporphyrinogen decarboxylase [bacterium]|nr:uroporphyrinogen decarboxylase [bacterium]